MNDSLQTERAYAVGRHMIADFHGCAYDKIATVDAVREVLLEAARRAGATIVTDTFRYFSPHGVSGFVVISESHFSIHTWPEYSYAAVDIFTCGTTVDFNIAVESLQNGFEAHRVEIAADLFRGSGIGAPPGAPPTSQSITLERNFDELYARTSAWGMHLEIELLGCPVQTDSDLKELSARIAAALGHPQMRCQLAACPHKEKGVMISFSGCFHGMEIQAYKHLNSRSVYIEILSCSFIDPKSTGPLVMTLSHSDGYRLRVSMRH